MAGVWIFAENGEQIRELLHIGRQLAAMMGTTVSVLTSQDRDRARDYIDHGADEIMLLVPLAEDQSPDVYIPLITEEAQKRDPDLILVSATFRGKDMAARIAARLDTGLCSGCMALNFDEESKTLVMERLVYGGAGVQTVTCTTRPATVTVLPGTYEPAIPEAGRRGQVRELPAPAPSAVKVMEKRAKEREARDISEARVVVCVGRGVSKREDIALARQLAEVLEGEIACTRPISEEYHWLPEELCIGLSGAQVKPDLYMGLGVSGQVQHVTGIRNARVIAVVNKDEKAPIFEAADFGIVGDLYDVVPKLIAELEK
jgi:electron transfer flavoprotein alpha subunit